jgi:hypothetical protein
MSTLPIDPVNQTLSSGQKLGRLLKPGLLGLLGIGILLLIGQFSDLVTIDPYSGRPGGRLFARPATTDITLDLGWRVQVVMKRPPITVLKVEGDPVLQLDATPKRALMVRWPELRLSGTFYDQHGAPVARLRQNQWEFNPTNAFSLTRSRWPFYGRLEVAGLSGDTHLTITMVNAHHARIRGKLYGKSGPIVIADTGLQVGQAPHIASFTDFSVVIKRPGATAFDIEGRAGD